MVRPPHYAMSFPCDYCHSGVSSDTTVLVCPSCRTAYRYDQRSQRFIVTSSPPQFFEILALLVLLLGIVVLFAPKIPQAVGWLLAFIGFAIHLWNGWRTGVIRSDI